MEDETLQDITRTDNPGRPEKELSQRAKIKIAYMDGILTKKEMEQKLAEEKIQSPKDEPNFYEEGYCQECKEPLNNAIGEFCPKCEIIKAND